MLTTAYAGFILNLFNLIPVIPLDGGNVVAVVSPKIWIIGIPLLVSAATPRIHSFRSSGIAPITSLRK